MNETSDLVIYEWKFQEILEVHEPFRWSSEYFDSKVTIGRHSFPLSVTKEIFTIQELRNKLLNFLH